MRRAILPLVVALLTLPIGPADAQPRVDKNVVYGMVSGTALLLDVHHPTAPNGAGVIWVGGSGWATDPEYGTAGLKDSLTIFRPWMQRLLSAGYTVFVVNHRQSPLFHYPDPVRDVQRAVRFVLANAKQFDVEPSRVGGMGDSSGAHLIALAGVMDGDGSAGDADAVERQPIRLGALVLRAAPTNLSTVRESDGLARLGAFLQMSAPTDDTPKTSVRYRTYVEASPVTYLDPNDPPTLLIHGDADTSVPHSQSVAFQAALTKVGVANKLITIPGGGHRGPNFGLAQGSAAPDYLSEMVKWFDTYLKPRSGAK
jgi:acetyl esterase/lipase